jgi:hypothetical protein
MGAKTWTVFSAQGRERYRKQKAFSDHGKKVDLVVLNFVCVGVIGPLLIHLIKVDSHALNKRCKTPSTHASPCGLGSASNMDSRRKRFKMNRDINGRVNYPLVIKFEIKNGDSNLDVFCGAGAAQQFNCINDERLSQGGPA